MNPINLPLRSPDMANSTSSSILDVAADTTVLPFISSILAFAPNPFEPELLKIILSFTL